MAAGLVARWPKALLPLRPPLAGHSYCVTQPALWLALGHNFGSHCASWHCCHVLISWRLGLKEVGSSQELQEAVGVSSSWWGGAPVCR